MLTDGICFGEMLTWYFSTKDSQAALIKNGREKLEI